jgi:hypothetical protein
LFVGCKRAAAGDGEVRRVLPGDRARHTNKEEIMTTPNRFAHASHGRRVVLAGLAALAAGLAVAVTDAQASSPETVITKISFPSFPSSPPNMATYGGTFSASGAVSDSGNLSADTLFSAVPSPTVAVLHTTQTLSGSKGTIVLRCEQILKSGVVSSGSCSIEDATGAYAGLSGAVKLTGVTDFNSSPVTVTDTIALGSL